MKIVLKLSVLAPVLVLAWAAPCFAAGLSEASLAPAWTSASQAEKDAWIGAFKFERADADRAGIAACLDKMTPLPPFETNKLEGVTSMCATIIARGGL